MLILKMLAGCPSQAEFSADVDVRRDAETASGDLLQLCVLGEAMGSALSTAARNDHLGKHLERVIFLDPDGLVPAERSVWAFYPIPTQTKQRLVYVEGEGCNRDMYLAIDFSAQIFLNAPMSLCKLQVLIA